MFAQYLQALHADAEGATSSSDTNAPPIASEEQPLNQNSTSRKVDLESDAAFPALGAGPGLKGTQVKSPLGWGLGSSQRAATAPTAAKTPSTAAPPSVHAYRDTLSLPTNSIHLASSSTVANAAPRKRGEDAQPTTLGEAVQYTSKAFPTVKVDASTSKNMATFHFAGASEKEVLKAKADLLARIVKKVSIVVQVPGSTRPFIIGQKGRTLKAIEDETGAHVQLPPREAIEEDVAPETASDEYQEPNFPVTVFGTQFSCDQARARIEAIVAERASKIVHTVKVPANQFESSVWPFVRSRAEPLYAAEGVSASYIPNTGLEIKGDSKDKCQAWAAELGKMHQQIKLQLKSASFNIAKRQHRFLRDPAASTRLFEETGFVVELPPTDSPEENVLLRGIPLAKDSRANAMAFVMELSESGEIGTVDLLQYFKGAAQLTNACRYFNRQPHVLQSGLSSGVSVDLPTRAQVNNGHAELEVVANSVELLQSAVKQVQDTCALLAQPDRLAAVEVDSLHHKHLVPGGSKSRQMKAVQDKFTGLDIIWPQNATTSSVLVAWPDASSTPALSDLRSEIDRVISELGHVESISFDVPQKYHSAIQGPNNTTLNVLVGEQKSTAVSFGPGDKITVRGPKHELVRVKKDIESLVKRAETEDVETIHETSFDLEARFVGYIVGKNGAGVNKLNNDLGVRIQFEDLDASGSAEDGQAKKKKSSKPRVHVTIRGRRENVDEARKRIIAHAERVADETTATISLPPTVDRRVLIGKQGTYVQRLETKYEVRILFPKAEDSDNAITLRGPRKGVDGAKRELNELIEYEVENSHTTVVRVPAKAVARIVGRGGAQVNDIMAETGASIDVQTPQGDEEVTVTLKGSKEACLAAKKSISAIAQEAQDETVVTMNVAKSLQPGLIGRGGQNLKDMIIKCGGPSDARSQGAMIRFPRPTDTITDEITLRGKRSIIEKLQQHIESYITREQSRVVYGVHIPKPSHASIIGRGGVGINELSSKHNVRVLFPGWKDNGAGLDSAMINEAEVQDAPADSLVRIVGSEDDCKAAADELLRKQASTPLRASRTSTPQASVTRTVDVPAQHHRVIADGGRFFRRHVPPRVNIAHGDATLPSQLPKPQSGSTNGVSARIDLDEGESSTNEIIQHWEVYPLPNDAENTTIPWIITGQSEESVAKAEAAVVAAMERVQDWTHVAYVNVGRSNMARVIGKGGSGLENLRVASRGDVEALGRKDADTISIVGPQDGLLAAKSELEQLEAR